MARPPITKSRPYTPSSGAFAGQTFTTERAYRNALARLKGFASWDAQRAGAKAVGGKRAYRRLRPSEREAYDRVAAAATLMRSEKLPLTHAARRVGTTPAAIKKFANDALIRETRGRYSVADRDRLLRRLHFITSDGIIEVSVDDSRAASLIASYDNAVKKWLAGDGRALERFVGKSIRAGGKRYEFLTDPDLLIELGRRGEVSFESIYASAA